MLEEAMNRLDVELASRVLDARERDPLGTNRCHISAGHSLLGSVAEAVVRTASVAVLTVHPQSEPRPREIDHVLVPHDFSAHSLDAVDVAAEWSRALAARVTLLHVVEPTVYPEFYAVDLMPEETLQRLRERSRIALEKVAREAFDGHVGGCLVASGSAL